jgi:urea carboxylase-associated protein 2
MNACDSDRDALREINRRRYEELRAAGQGATAQALPGPSAVGLPLPGATIHDEEIAPGGYWTTRLRRGEGLRIVDERGDAAVALVAWNANETSERINVADTMKVQWSARLCKGRVVLTEMGRVAFSITEDSSGAHDAIVGPSTAASMAAMHGQGPWRNSRDNFVAAALKLGLDRRDVPACLTLFAPAIVRADGSLGWEPARRHAGQFVDLRAELDLWLVLSNCPHPLDATPPSALGPVRAIRFVAPPPLDDDPCRTAGPEARRAFAATERYLR